MSPASAKDPLRGKQGACFTCASATGARRHPSNALARSPERKRGVCWSGHARARSGRVILRAPYIHKTSAQLQRQLASRDATRPCKSNWRFLHMLYKRLTRSVGVLLALTGAAALLTVGIALAQDGHHHVAKASGTHHAKHAKASHARASAATCPAPPSGTTTEKAALAPAGGSAAPGAPPSGQSGPEPAGPPPAPAGPVAEQAPPQCSAGSGSTVSVAAGAPAPRAPEGTLEGE